MLLHITKGTCFGSIQLSTNSHANQLARMKQPARICSNAAAPSGSSTMPSSKSRIRWSQDLHDRFVESVNRLGGSESKKLYYMNLLCVV